MKKIKYAWIEQIIEFDSADEIEIYLYSLDHGKKPMNYSVIEQDGLTIRIRKQYNSNELLERG